MDLYGKSVSTTSSSSRKPSNGTAVVVTPAISSSNIVVVASSSSIIITSNTTATTTSSTIDSIVYQPTTALAKQQQLGNCISSTSISTSSTASIPASSSNFSSSSSSSSTDMCSCDNQNVATSSSALCTSNKRKRRLTTDSNDDTKDPELGFEPPSAKRQQRLPALYGSDQSNLSSVYTSPVVSADAQNTQELLSIRSSPAEELPESSHSPLPDSPDSPPSPDRGGSKLSPVVVRYAKDQVTSSSSTLAAESDEQELDEDEDDVLDDSCEDYSLDEEEDDDDEEIHSSTVSPVSSNDERTPAPQQQPQSSSSSSTVPNVKTMDAYLTYNRQNRNSIHEVKTVKLEDYVSFNQCMSPAQETTVRQCPLPALSWANAADVWKLMCQRDEQDSHLRSITMLEPHPGLQPRMRAILLDWLIEVCEVYKLHRETFYLAVDYLDRYLHKARKVQKTHLQLIGITCLFVAAKVEEIYPPKIGEFAYVTDGACTEKDILEYEKYLLQALDWEISPITVTGWLGVYMQLNVNNRTPASFSQIGKQAANDGGIAAGVCSDDAFIYPQFSGYEFVQTSQLLDLCTLDVGMANYPYSVLAAAAISHTFNRETALRCSGLDWQVIQPCALWMEPFFRVISKRAPFLQLNEQNEQVSNKFSLAHVCPNIVTDDSHIIQTHTTTMDMYDELLMAQDALHAIRARTQASPATALRAPDNLLTPPASSHKPDEYLGDEDGELVTGQSNSSSSLANRENVALTGSGN
ncbi:G1/S-specific cyclin-E [Drosophila tropicalis]|uniref:G1/S-specific cyclin-E n=1 Tax=Drosophila tropicalis TaxID=46794 RepID=UPI0035AB80A3